MLDTITRRAFDTKRSLAVNRGNHLARWLTAIECPE
jgi:hypothetical protein